MASSESAYEQPATPGPVPGPVNGGTGPPASDIPVVELAVSPDSLSAGLTLPGPSQRQGLAGFRDSFLRWRWGGPPYPPYPGFWAAVGWCLAFLIVSQVLPAIPIAGVAFAIILQREASAAPTDTTAPREAGTADRDQEPQERLNRDVMDMVMVPALWTAQIIGTLFVLVLARLALGKHWMRQLALRRPSWTQLVLVLLGTPAFMILAGLIGEAAKRSGLPTFDYQKQLVGMFEQFRSMPWAAILLFGVAPGFLEELLFRGYIGRGLVGRYGVVVGVLLTSLLFGLMHVDPPHVVATAVMGAGLHFIYLTTRSLWLPMLVHFLNNSLGVLFAIHAETLPAWLQELDQGTPQMTGLVACAAGAVVVGVGWALLSGRARLVATDPTEPAWQPDYAGHAFPVAGLGIQVRPTYCNIEYPPPDSGTVVVRPRPQALPLCCAALAIGLLVMLLYAQAVQPSWWQGLQKRLSSAASPAPETSCRTLARPAMVADTHPGTGLDGLA